MTFRTKLATAPMVLALMLALSACGNSEAESAKAEADHAGEAGGHKEGEGGHDDGDEITITDEALRASDVTLAVAAPGPLRETLNLTGRIMLQPAARAELHAPYPGPVRAVLRNVGDVVRRGEALARVESAESLQTYAVASPIAGIVLERQTNIGDLTSDQPLFVVGDLTRVQAELNVATRDIGKVAQGQTVVITGLDGVTRLEARISSVLPTADAHTQTLIARAAFTVPAASPMRPGMAVRGAVVLAEQQAAVAVPKDAVQTLEGRNVVFVRVAKDRYGARPVTLGRAGGGMVEIVSGLTAGETYVAKNAFLVKAEIGKGSASHDH